MSDYKIEDVPPDVSCFAFDDLRSLFSSVNPTDAYVQVISEEFNPYIHYYAYGTETKIPYISKYQLSTKYEPYPMPDIKNLIKKKPPLNKSDDE